MKLLMLMFALFAVTCYGEETTTPTKTKEEIRADQQAEKQMRAQAAKRQQFYDQRERRRATERKYESCLAQCRTSCGGS